MHGVEAMAWPGAPRYSIASNDRSFVKLSKRPRNDVGRGVFDNCCDRGRGAADRSAAGLCHCARDRGDDARGRFAHSLPYRCLGWLAGRTCVGNGMLAGCELLVGARTTAHNDRSPQQQASQQLRTLGTLRRVRLNPRHGVSGAARYEIRLELDGSPRSPPVVHTRRFTCPAQSLRPPTSDVCTCHMAMRPIPPEGRYGAGDPAAFFLRHLAELFAFEELNHAGAKRRGIPNEAGNL